MIQKLSLTAVFGLALLFSSSDAQAQYGGVTVQLGGYPGFRNYGYGNGYYGGYGYNSYSTPYYSNYGSRYGGYNNYYNNRYNYNAYPSYGYGYVAPRYYVPSRSYQVPIRRYRYR